MILSPNAFASGNVHVAAAAAFRAVWVTRYGNNINPRRIEEMRDVLPEDLVEDLMKAATEGADAQYDGPRDRVECKAHRSFMQHLNEGLSKL